MAQGGLGGDGAIVLYLDCGWLHKYKLCIKIHRSVHPQRVHFMVIIIEKSKFRKRKVIYMMLTSIIEHFSHELFSKISKLSYY